MSAVGDLLPKSSTAFEEALAAGMSDTLPVPYRQMMDPATTPAKFLPFLAAHQSVDLWYGDWPLGRKRQMVGDAIRLARIKGTRQAVIDFLAYVDGELVDAVAYPTRFIFGRAVIGRTPVGHPPHVTRYLVKVETFKESDAFVFGRSIIGRAFIKTPNREKLNRCLTAITVAMPPEMEARVDFSHKRLLTAGDAPLAGGGHLVGEYVDRTVLL